MNATWIWVVLPGATSLVLFFLRRREKLVLAIGLTLCLALALLAWLLPIGEPISIGGPLPLPSFTVEDTLYLLGRRLVINADSRSMLLIIYLSLAAWLGGSRISDLTRLFVPVALGMGALFTAALSVDPFLYAALLIAMAVMVSIPILSPPGKPVSSGVLRLLIFQIIGMGFILFASWFLEGMQINPANPALFGRVALLMGFGFAFLMAIFPFHTWIPMIAEEAHPYAAGFVLFLLPTIVSIFGLEFISRYAWLRSVPALLLVLRGSGLLMVIVGGIWASFQRHLGRIFGYATIVEIGFSLLALSLASGTGDAPIPPRILGIFFTLLVAEAIGMVIWAEALSVIRQQAGGLSFEQTQGIVKRLPVATTALLLAHFSLAGMPLLAGFPAQLALWFNLTEQGGPSGLLALIGCAGLFAAGLRALAALVTGAEQTDQKMQENRWQAVFFMAGWVVLLLLGMLPQFFYPSVVRFTSSFLLTVP
jgi:formate hydrogenlyase subunit 3/multisubunit Na+/H+ antiporter MnhD subunit